MNIENIIFGEFLVSEVYAEAFVVSNKSQDSLALSSDQQIQANLLLVRLGFEANIIEGVNSLLRLAKVAKRIAFNDALSAYLEYSYLNASHALEANNLLNGKIKQALKCLAANKIKPASLLLKLY